MLPCYNEGKSLRALLERSVACARRRGLTPKEFHLILVDNGSADDSAAVLKQMTKEPNHEFFSIVTVPVNQGYGYGVHQGLKATSPGIVGWSHADEQCDPEDAFKAWERIRDTDAKILVKGTRSGRALGNWLFSRGFELVSLIILWRWLPETNAQPKVFDSSLLSALDAPPLGFAFDLYVLLRAREQGFRFQEVPVFFPPRKHGQSRWAATFRSKWRTIWGLVTFMVRYRLGRV